MKKPYIFTILLLLVITSAGCKKDPLEPLEQSLIGSWEIRQVIGGQIANSPGTFAPGNGRILQFTDKTYAYIISNKVTYTGSYTVGMKGSGRDREYTLNFINNGFLRFVKIDDDKLTLYYGPEVADGNTLIYARVNDPVLQTN